MQDLACKGHVAQKLLEESSTALIQRKFFAPNPSYLIRPYRFLNLANQLGVPIALLKVKNHSKISISGRLNFNLI